MKSIKRLAVLALICSIFLTLFLFYQSSLAASKSSEISNTVKDIIKELFNVNETIMPKKLDFNEEAINKAYYFSGERIKLPMSFTPSGAGRDVTYTFSSESCTVDRWGYITHNGAYAEEVVITATSVHDPNVTDTVTVQFLGITPRDESIERIEVELVGDDERLFSPDELVVGMPYTIRTYAIIKYEYLEGYGLEDGRVELPELPYDLITDGDEEVCIFDSYEKKVTFIKEYTGDILFRYKNSTSSYFDGGFIISNINQRLSADTHIDPDYEYIPSGKLISSVGEYDAENDMFVVRVAQDELSVDIYSMDMADGRNYMSRLVYADDESKNVGSVSDGHTVKRRVNNGECDLYLVSYFDEDVKTRIKVIFEGEKPSSLKLIGQKQVSIYGTAKFSYDTDVKLYSSDAVKWSIVEGKKNADIKNGILTARRIGKVVIRIESVDDPSLYDELTVNIRLWETFSQFVRKMIGHFTLFAFLGMGYAASSFLLLKRKWLSPIVTSIGLFAVASLTELVQYYTEGRFGSWYDVLFNFLGGITGMAFVALCFTAFALIMKKAKPDSYARLKDALKQLSFRTAFKKNK